MKFHIIVYWCQMNYSDSARIRAVLTNAWWTFVETIDEADIVIIDTCSVRQKSEDKVFWKLKEIPKNKKIWITWCMIQHNLNMKKLNKLEETVNNMFNLWNFQWNLETIDPIIAWLDEDSLEDIIYKFQKQNFDMEWFKKRVLLLNKAFNPLFKKIKSSFDNLELIFRIDDLWYIPKVLEKLGYSVNISEEDITNEYTWIVPKWANQLLDKNSKVSYVPIQTWCSQFCAYCIVPYARWLEKNRDINEIINEVKQHLSAWAEEIVLVWQIVNKHPEFIKILKEILKLSWLRWLRYTSPYPTYYSDELFQLHNDEEKLCPHIHIPVQSGSTPILKKMFRWYTSEEFYWFIDKIRWLNRPISITTDIIIWFPDETEEDFKNSLDLMNYSKFDMVFMWIYSPRPWTLWARKYVDNIPQEVKKERWNRMNELLKKSSLENNKQDIWRICDVLITSVWDNIVWYNDQTKNVIIKDTSYWKVWEFVKVKIVWWESFTLFWEIL